jgi:lysozyme family protein
VWEILAHYIFVHLFHYIKMKTVNEAVWRDHENSESLRRDSIIASILSSGDMVTVA